jgi:DeoR family transcriptional regulator, aga operon transcriptional repressor
MLNEERRLRIQGIVTQHKRILVKEISKEFDISEVTVRKDLEVLEKRGILSRVHGGAILNQSSVHDIALTEKEHIYPKEKQLIGEKASQLIREGDVILLDSGSTTTQIARNIKFKKDIKVITNAVNIASELAGSEIEVILTGGFLREKSFSLVGPIAEDTLRHINADKLFLGVDGIHFEFGLTTPNLMEARVNQLMIKKSLEVILVSDSSKFGKRSMSFISDVSSIQQVITDNGIHDDDLRELEELGVKVFLV